MNGDLMQRLETMIHRLHDRALVLSHPKQDSDMGLALQAIALSLEAQRDLAHQLRQIAEKQANQ